MKPSDELLEQLRNQTRAAGGEPTEEVTSSRGGFSTYQREETWPTKDHWYILGIIGVIVVVCCIIVNS